MTPGSASSGGHARDTLSGRRKVAIVTGASSGIGLENREETDRKELSSGCELPEHYVRDEPTEHCRSETGGRRHWHCGNGQTRCEHRNSEFWNR
jgi:hypothetical protein